MRGKKTHKQQADGRFRLSISLTRAEMGRIESVSDGLPVSAWAKWAVLRTCSTLEEKENGTVEVLQKG